MIDHETANKKRDTRLRREILRTLDRAKQHGPRGGLHARKLVDLVNDVMPPGQGFEDDNHAMGLIRDLVNKQMIAEEKLPRKRHQSFTLDYIFVRILAAGTSNVNQTSPPDPDIDDDRITEDM